MTILKIDTSARGADSNSRQITDYLVNQLGETVIERDLGQNPLPIVSAEDLIGIHGSSDDNRSSLRENLAISDSLINELIKAENLVFGVAMYNFSIPATLKQWIDHVCRAGITFNYGAEGPIGLSGVKRAFIVTATGGTPVGSPVDFASGYLEWICKFLGVEEIFHIDASGSKGEPEKIVAAAKQQIDQLLS